MSILTRWKPRRVFCTTQADHADKPGIEYVVKFRQDKAGTAALISEIIGTRLLAAGGVRVLDSRLVLASDEFASSYQGKNDVSYLVSAGLHYGTILRQDVENGPPLRREDLAEPCDLLAIWAFDSWLCTTDRKSEGNLLLVPASARQFHLIAADQSDCFGGAGRFADGSWKQVLTERGAAESVSFWQGVVFDCGGASALRDAAEKVGQAARKLEDVLAEIPPDWWKTAQLEPKEVKEALDRRQRRLTEILDIQQWEGLAHDTQGGQLL
jgi:hypothetical protein